MATSASSSGMQSVRSPTCIMLLNSFENCASNSIEPKTGLDYEIRLGYIRFKIKIHLPWPDRT